MSDDLNEGIEVSLNGISLEETESSSRTTVVLSTEHNKKINEISQTMANATSYSEVLEHPEFEIYLKNKYKILFNRVTSTFIIFAFFNLSYSDQMLKANSHTSHLSKDMLCSSHFCDMDVFSAQIKAHSSKRYWMDDVANWLDQICIKDTYAANFDLMRNFMREVALIDYNFLSQKVHENFSELACKEIIKKHDKNDKIEDIIVTNISLYRHVYLQNNKESVEVYFQNQSNKRKRYIIANAVGVPLYFAVYFISANYNPEHTWKVFSVMFFLGITFLNFCTYISLCICGQE